MRIFGSSFFINKFIENIKEEMSYEKLEVTKGLMEAYVGMYAPQEEVENLNEAPAAPAKPKPSSLFNFNSPEARKDMDAVRAAQMDKTFDAGGGTKSLLGGGGLLGTYSRGLQRQRQAAGQGGQNPPRQPGAGTPPAAPAAARTAPAGGTVLAKQGGVEGKLDKATGKFTAGAFTDAEKSRYASVSAKNAPKPGTQAAGPESIKPKTENPLLKDGELKRMQAASMMRQQGRNLPSGKVPTSADLKPAATPSTTTSTAFKPSTPSLGSSSSSIQSAGSMAGAKAFPVKPATSVQATAATTKPVAPEVKATNTAAAAPKPVTANPSGGFSTKPGDGKPYKDGPLFEDSVDIFDVVMEYLVAEGYADTNQAALVIMANMSEEWREEILEAKYGTAAGRKALAKKIRKGKNIGKKGPGTGFKAVERAAEKGGAEDPTAVAAAAMYKTYGGKKG